MRFAHLLSRITGTPWLISSDGASAVTALLHSRVLSDVRFHDDNPDLDGTDNDKATSKPEVLPMVAVVPVRGVLGKNLDSMSLMCGGCDVDRVMASVSECMAMESVKVCVMRFDTPGGAATGIPEAHTRLIELRKQYPEKLLLAFVDGACCSGGIYLAAACQSISCTRSAQLGSIGAITQIRLRVEHNKQEGLEVRTYKYGKFKDLGNPNRLPTKEEEKILQSRIDTLGEMFAADMRAARPDMKPEVYDALVYFGAEAVALGLADEMPESFEAFIRALSV